MQAIYKLARETGEECRQLMAESELERRGIDGYTETVWNLKTGKILGVQRKFSDRCLELKLKARDPAKYSDKHQVDVHSNQPAAQVIWHVTGVVLGQQPPPKTYDLPAKDVTEALPEKADPAKPQ
jgi:hypothetical protein